MSADIFLQYRARITGIWVDLETCVLALEARIARNKRGASILKWATFGVGTLTGGAGLDVLTPVVGLLDSNGEYVLSVLALMTSALTAAAPLCAFDAKIERDTTHTHECHELQSRSTRLLYEFAVKPLVRADDEEVSRLEDKVDRQMRKDVFDRQAHAATAANLVQTKSFAQTVWIGPPVEAAPEVNPQGDADLQPITRG